MLPSGHLSAAQQLLTASKRVSVLDWSACSPDPHCKWVAPFKEMGVLCVCPQFILCVWFVDKMFYHSGKHFLDIPAFLESSLFTK